MTGHALHGAALHAAVAVPVVAPVAAGQLCGVRRAGAAVALRALPAHRARHLTRVLGSGPAGFLTARIAAAGGAASDVTEAQTSGGRR